MLPAGLPTETEEQVQAAARTVQEKGVDVVLAKLGTKGSMLVQKDEVLTQPIIKAEKVHLKGLPFHSTAARLQVPANRRKQPCHAWCWTDTDYPPCIITTAAEKARPAMCCLSLVCCLTLVSALVRKHCVLFMTATHTGYELCKCKHKIQFCSNWRFRSSGIECRLWTQPVQGTASQGLSLSASWRASHTRMP